MLFRSYLERTLQGNIVIHLLLMSCKITSSDCDCLAFSGLSGLYVINIYKTHIGQMAGYRGVDYGGVRGF